MIHPTAKVSGQVSWKCPPPTNTILLLICVGKVVTYTRHSLHKIWCHFHGITAKIIPITGITVGFLFGIPAETRVPHPCKTLVEDFTIRTKMLCAACQTDISKFKYHLRPSCLDEHSLLLHNCFTVSFPL